MILDSKVKIRCLLVDDEPLAIQLLQTHLKRMEIFEVTATSSNALKALEIIRNQAIDLMFLDIKMPQLNGIDFLKTLRHPPAVIITTAFREYAVEGYDLDVVDYLLKPITFERFFKAIDRYLRNREIQPQNILPTSKDQAITIRSGGKFHRLEIADILYIESNKDYITIHCSQRKVTTKYRITVIEQELRQFNFLRIHRSFLININKITAFTVNDVEIVKQVIPIGTNYKELVQQALKHH
ncbi:response regulator transcription factor [Sphingobacterium sp. DR205]|nr:response regulator transcription factor [Sphingobacterium sp. DR205]